MTVNLSALAGAGAQFLDNNGTILSGGKLYSYAAGTTTPQTTYTSASGATAHTNPIILNSAGRVATGEIWLTEGAAYKFSLYTSADVLIATYDDISGINDLTEINDLTNNLANSANPALGDALVGFRQSNSSGNLTGSVGRTVHQKFQETVSVKDFGAAGNGTTNDTDAIQAAINACQASGQDVFIPSGDYLITGIVVYAGSVLRFDALAWLNMSQDGIAIRSVSSVGGTTATGNISQIKLFDPKVDMKSYAGFGILFECTTRSYIQNPFVRNISENNYQYTDAYSGAQTYASTGIILKGITGVYGCYYNAINNYRVSGTGTSGGAGIWLGTSLTGNNQRPNFNQINFGTVSNIGTGIDIGIGGDNYIVQPEVSTANVGIRIGSNTFPTGALRTKIVKPYLELNSTAGIQIRANATDLLIEQVGSFSGTTTPIDNAAGDEVVIGDFRSGSYNVRFFDANTAGNESPTTANGFWTRSGAMVTVTFSASDIDTTGMTGGNSLYISLPFAPEYRATGSVILENFTFPAGKTQANSFVGSAETRAQIYASGTGGTSIPLTVSSINSGVSDIIQFSLTYLCELPV